MTDTLKTDIYLAGRETETLFSDRSPVNIKNYRGDIILASGRENLAQSVINRLFTRVGELSNIGHPDYGSRLYKIIGEPNSKRTRAFAEFYIREALSYENRVKKILDIITAPPAIEPARRNIMEITIVILIKEDDEPLTISMDYNL
jgi:phage baseplate assembly protein W